MSVISDEMQKLLKGGSVLRMMFEEGKHLTERYGAENVFDFSLGNPSLPAPEAFNRALIRAVEETDPFVLHSYMNNAGYEDTRQAIANNLNRRFGEDFDYTHITMTVGAANALVAAFKVLLDPEDEVIVFAPYFLEYANYIANFGGITKVVPPNPPTFMPDLDALADAITPRTKAVLINNPNNPTGVVYGEDEICALAEVLEAAQTRLGRPIYLISDEPYRELVYDGAVVPFPANFYSNTLIAYSFSKSLSVPGERIGYLAVSPKTESAGEISRAAAIAVRVIGCVNAPSLQQRAIMEVLDITSDMSEYERNRKLLLDGLDSAGFEYVFPRGAFYVFMKTPIEDDNAFAALAKDKYRILVASGSAFCCPGYVRIAYCVPTERIERALPYFAALAEDYK
ncbi:MAG: pyridoxal phosphate-dependent aminotransferase [Lachnospiraceae bacterium]|jgi:aspartate aminotransferase